MRARGKKTTNPIGRREKSFVICLVCSKDLSSFSWLVFQKPQFLSFKVGGNMIENLGLQFEYIFPSLTQMIFIK